MQGNPDVKYSLICAVREGKLERARELINSFGLSYSQAWGEGYDLLCDALKYRHGAVARLLITSGSKVNSESKRDWNTPLHFAVKNGDLDIIEMLLEKGARIDVANENGETPLQFGILNKKKEATELLLNHGADVNCVCTSTWRNGYAPLHFACEQGSREVIELLISRGALVDFKGKDDITPLHIAAKKGYKQIVEDLLDHGASAHSVCTSGFEEGYEPLHFAAKQGSEEAVQLLLDRGADLNAKAEGNLTSLHIATKSGHEKVVRLLLERGGPVDDHDEDGKTVLHLAVERGNLAMIEDVLKHCPNRNNQSNKSSLNTAVYGDGKEYKKIVETLLEYGLTIDPKGPNIPELLHAAVEKGYLEIVEDLLKNGAGLNTLHASTSKKGSTLLHNAAKNQQEKIARLLIKYGAEINAEDETGKSPIFYATEKGNAKMFKLLLSHEANVNDDPELLSTAVKEGSREIVAALLQRDADINAIDDLGRTPLHYTALSEDLIEFHCDNIKGDIARLLLNKGAEVDAKLINGVTALHAASFNGYEKVVKALLQFGACVNARMDDRDTPLHLAASRGNDEICKMLLSNGAYVNVDGRGGKTPLHMAAAARRGHQEVIETLLRFGAHIDSRDEDGNTPLHVASEGGHVAAVITLLEHGSDINITSKNNRTPVDASLAGLLRQLNHLDDYLPHPGDYSCKIATETLKRHIIKMKTANLFVSEQNLMTLMGCRDEMRDYQQEFDKEITVMKKDKINNTNLSFYDILTKSTNSLAISLINENIVEAFESEDYTTKFPKYSTWLKRHFRNGMERKELRHEAIKVLHFLFNNFPELPHNCIEKIICYLTNEDLRFLMDFCSGPDSSKTQAQRRKNKKSRGDDKAGGSGDQENGGQGPSGESEGRRLRTRRGEEPAEEWEEPGRTPRKRETSWGPRERTKRLRKRSGK